MGNSISSVTVAPTAAGCVITVSPRGTVRESRVVNDVAARTLKGDDKAAVVIDVSSCTYVDSTFLGTLMDLFCVAGGTGGGGTGGRFAIAASPEHRKKLLGVARLDTFIPGVDTAPTAVGSAIVVPTPDASPREILRHIMECHQKLAEMDCPMRPVFARIATQMQAEFEQSPDWADPHSSRG